MKRCSLPTMALVSFLLGLGALVVLPPAATAADRTAPTEPTLVPVRATPCPATAPAGEATCLAEALPADAPQAASTDPTTDPTTGPTTDRAGAVATPQAVTSNGYSPADLASLYRIPAGLQPSSTIGIVDVGSDPNTQAQMAYFRSRFHLPACTPTGGCFREVSQDGSGPLPGPDSSWVTEIAIDVQAVSAICPTCHILLVDAASAEVSDLARATLTATRMGASFVSMSFGAPESAGTAALRTTYYGDPDVTYVAATGDSGYGGGALFPASAPNVVAAGGTTVTQVNGTWRQTAWSGSGSGCSSQQAVSAAQSMDALGSVCGGSRVVSDLSALADPNTGMLFYRGGRWWKGGGTSLAAPILTSLYALAGNHTNPLSVYADASGLTDITSGSTGSCRPARLCTAGTGWDGPTGLGTPSGLQALAAGASMPSYTSASVGSLSVRPGYPVRLVYHLADRATGIAVPAASVRLERQRPGGTFAAVRTATTGAGGTVVLSERPKAATTYRVVFAGDVTHAATTSATVAVTFSQKVRVTSSHGRLRTRVRAPWGGAVRSTTLTLQRRHGHGWRSIRSLRTNRHGVATAPVARGAIYRLRYGGGAWRPGHTGALRVR